MKQGQSAQLSRYGAIAKELPFNYGKVFFVVNNVDSWFGDVANQFTPDGDGNVRLFSTLSAAYAACVSGRNDVIIVDGNTAISETTGIAWTKNRINVIGIGPNRLTDQGAKITNVATDATAYLLKVTGTRNSFKNLKFIQHSTQGTALTVAQFGGEGNHYENCSFIFDQSTNLGGTTTNEVVMGEDSGTFVNCEFGADTLVTSGARAVMLVKQVTSGQQLKSSRFQDCVWKISSSNSGATMITVNSSSDVLFSTLLKNPIFEASVDAGGGVAITNAVQSASGLTAGTINLYFPAAFNCTHVCNTATAGIQVVGPTNATTTGTPSTPA